MTIGSGGLFWRRRGDKTDNTRESVHDARQRDREILRRAVRKALLDHKRAGNSIAVLRDGKVVIIPPEEIQVEPLDDEEIYPLTRS